MIESRIDHIGLNVQNLDESIEFYRSIFDFDVIEKWDNPRQAFVGKGNVVLGLMEAPDYDFCQYTKAHVAFPCKPGSFENVVVSVRDHKAEVVAGPKPQRGGETILFRDPSGNILEVCYPPVIGGNET